MASKNQYNPLLVTLLLLSGCAVKHDVPAADRALDMADRFVKPCPKLDLPPVPQDVVLNIQGDKVTANAGGEILLRGYAQARQLLR